MMIHDRAFQLQNWSCVCGPAALPDDGALRLGLLEDLPPDLRLRREALQQRLPDAQEELRENGKSYVTYKGHACTNPKDQT